MGNASRCAVRCPIPGRRVSWATRFSTEGLNTAPLCPRTSAGLAVPAVSRCQTPGHARFGQGGEEVPARAGFIGGRGRRGGAAGDGGATTRAWSGGEGGG